MFVFCIESSHSRGLGHLYRSLTLADELRRRGWSACFIVNDHQASRDIVKTRGFDVYGYELSAEAGSWEAALLRNIDSPTIWINDRLNTQSAHARAVTAAGLKIVTFDDRGDGAACADLNIAALVFDESAILSGRVVRRGVEFMILNPEIEAYRRTRHNLGSILVTMGGADTHGVTIKVARWLRDKSLRATIVTGPAFGHSEELADILALENAGYLRLICSVPSLAQEMALHDLAITGGGLTPFEAFACGLPCIVVANEDFEIPVGRALQRFGGARFVGHHTAFDLGPAFDGLDIEQMSRAAQRAVDLDGVRRVASLIGGLRP